jgi:predicted nucleotidyltransferase component of viral defense system
VHQWRKRKLLPLPSAIISGVPVWEWPAIATWARSTSRLASPSSSVLPTDAITILQTIGDSALGHQFYLAGGTALALQIAHRVSRDLDFFTRTPAFTLSSVRILNLLTQLFPSTEYTITTRSHEQVNCLIRGLKVSFIAYPFQLEETLQNFSSAQLAASPDVAAMKAYTIGRRAVARDYLDIYYALSSNVISIDSLMEKAVRIFQLDHQSVFDPVLFAKQLMYTDDLEDKEAALADVFDRNLTWETIESFLASVATDWLTRHVVSPEVQEL